MKTSWGIVLAALLVGCGSCPKLHETRADLLSKGIASPHLRLELRENVVAQVNERPATLALSWTEAKAIEIVIHDAAEGERLHRALPAASGALTQIELAGDGHVVLPDGIYRLDATDPAAPSEHASVWFEVKHCTVYY